MRGMKTTEIKAGDKVRAGGFEGVAVYVFKNNGDCAVRFPREIDGRKTSIVIWYAANQVCAA